MFSMFSKNDFIFLYSYYLGMEWGDFIQCTINDEIKKGIVHYVSDSYFEITFATLFSIENFQVSNDAWVGIQTADFLTGVTNDSREVSSIQVLEKNEDETFIQTRNIKVDDILIGVSHKESYATGRRYSVEGIQDAVIILDDLDAEDDEEIHVDTSHGLKILDGGIADLYNENEEEPAKIANAANPVQKKLEYVEREEEETIPIHERELTRTQKVQWFFETIRDHFSKNSEKNKKPEEQTQIINSLDEIFQNLENYAVRSETLWKKKLYTWKHFKPVISSIPCEFEPETFLHDLQTHYDTYMSTSFQYIPFSRSYTDSQKLICASDDDIDTIDTDTSFLAQTHENENVMILPPYYLPSFHRNQEGLTISKRTDKLLNQEPYVIEHVVEPIGKKIIATDDIIPSPQVLLDSYTTWKKESPDASLSDFLEYYGTSFHELPYEYAKMLRTARGSVKCFNTRGNSKESPRKMSTKAVKNIKCASSYDDYEKIQLEEDLKSALQSLKNMYKVQPLCYASSWDKIVLQSIPEIKAWGGDVWDSDALIHVLTDLYGNANAKTMVDDILRKKRPVRLGEYVNKKGSLFQFTYDSRTRNNIWVPKTMDKSACTHTPSKTHDITSLEKQKDVYETVLKYNDGVQWRRVNTFTKVSKFKEGKKKANKDGVGYTLESQEKWDSIHTNVEWSLFEKAERKMDMLIGGVSLRLPRKRDEIEWYYDVKTNKKSIPRHEYERQLIVLDAQHAKQHLDTMLQRWGVPDGEGHWVSRANGDILEVFADEIAFGDRGTLLNTQYDVQKNTQNEKEVATNELYGFQELSDTYEEIIEITKITSILKDDVLRLCSKIFEKSKEVESVRRVESFVTLISSSESVLYSKLDPFLNIDASKKEKYKAKWEKDVKFRVAQYKFVLDKENKKKYGLLGALVTSCIYFKAIAEKTTTLGFFSSSIYKVLMKTQKTTGTEHMFKYIFPPPRKEKPTVMEFEKWVDEFSSKMWMKDRIDAPQNAIPVNSHYSYVWSTFLPKNRKSLDKRGVDVTNVGEDTVSLYMQNSVKSASTVHFLGGTHENVSTLPALSDISEFSSEKGANREDVRSWVKHKIGKLPVHWLEIKNVDIFGRVKPNNKDSIVQNAMKQPLTLFRVIIPRFYSFCSKTYNWFIEDMKKKEYELPSMAKIWSIPDGVSSKLQSWNAQDVNVYKNMANEWKSVFAQSSGVGTMKEKLVDFQRILQDEVGAFVRLFDRPYHVDGDDMLYMNLWIYLCKHLQNEVSETYNLEYYEYTNLLKKTLEFYTGHLGFFHANLERFSDKSLEEANAYNAELERSEFLRVGALLDNETEQADRVLKNLKMGRWALGMTAVWKNVEDYAPGDARDGGEPMSDGRTGVDGFDVFDDAPHFEDQNGSYTGEGESYDDGEVGEEDS